MDKKGVYLVYLNNFFEVGDISFFCVYNFGDDSLNFGDVFGR